MSNSNPGLAYGQVPTAAQWNSYFAGKQDWSAILDAIIAAGGAPTDASGAGLSLATATVTYTKLGNIVFASGQITYPATANGNAAVIGGLPVAVPPLTYAKCPSMVFNNASVEIMAVTLPSSSTFELVAPASGAAITNAALSGKTINFQLIYPAS